MVVAWAGFSVDAMLCTILLNGIFRQMRVEFWFEGGLKEVDHLPIYPRKEIDRMFLRRPCMPENATNLAWDGE